MDKYKYIVANWKMNGSRQFVENYINELGKNISLFNKVNNKKVICVPYPYFYIAKSFEHYGIELGAQNVYYNHNNVTAYTGEVSIDMLLDFGIKYVILGHSERRMLFNENDMSLNKKILACLQNDIIPIVCLGSLNLTEKNFDGRKLLKKDLAVLFKDIDINLLNKVIIAYEPLDSIGTGKTPDISTISYVIKMIRNVIFDNYKSDIMILYGGSVSKYNCNTILNYANTDGLLIGGSSLKVKDFINILSLC